MYNRPMDPMGYDKPAIICKDPLIPQNKGCLMEWDGIVLIFLCRIWRWQIAEKTEILLVGREIDVLDSKLLRYLPTNEHSIGIWKKMLQFYPKIMINQIVKFTCIVFGKSGFFHMLFFRI